MKDYKGDDIKRSWEIAALGFGIVALVAMILILRAVSA